MRAAIFHPAARETIRGFPSEVRRSLGKAIWELQQEVRLGMPLSKSMPAVAIGVEELRVKDASGAYRAFFLCAREARHLDLPRVPEKDAKDAER